MSNLTYNAIGLNSLSQKFVINPLQNPPVKSDIVCAVTPILFEFGVNKNAHNKQAIAGFEALTKNWQVKRGTVSDLLNWVGSGKAIMMGTLPNATTRRQKSNIVSAQAIALDIDADLSIEDCLKIPFVRDYAAAIYTSASHQKQKGDVAPCDRYRVIFLLPEAVKDTALYEAAVQVVMERVGYADKACKDASRMFYGYDKTEVILCRPEAVLPAEFLGEVGDRLQREKAERLKQFEERKRRREEFGEADTDLETIQQALDFINPDCEYQDWLTVGLALHSHDQSLFYLWDGWSSRGSKYPKGGSRQLERQWSKFTAGGGVGIGSLFHIAQQHGFKFPERTFERGSGRNGGDRLIDAATWGKQRASEFIQWVSGKAAGLGKRCHKGFAAGNAPVVEPPEIIHWQNGDPVPSRSDYGDRPMKIRYARGSNPVELIAGLRSAGWGSVLDSSFMGEGKSHRAGMIQFEGCTGVYVDTNHNNPSVPNIERNYENLWARHNGLWRDEQGNLTRKKIEGKKPEVPSNCPSADLFPKLASKGYNIMASKDNPICGVCPHRGYCHTDPKFFKFQRGNALAAPQIRADLQSLPNPEDWDYSNDYAILEEATNQARAALKEISGTWGDLLQNFDEIERNAPETHEKLKPFKDALRKVFEMPQGRYGLDHETIMDELPMSLSGNVGEIMDSVLLAIAPEVALAKADRVSGAGKEFKSSMKLVNAMYRSEAREQNERLLENLPNAVLLPLLRVWNEERGSIRLERDRLIVTQPDIRKQSTVQAFGFRLFLDATGNKQAIAAGFGLAENSIIEIQQELPALDNLTVYQTHMTGIKSRSRSDSAKQRIAAYQQAWREKDPNVQFLGLKGEEAIAGWWFNHNRGSNKFKGRSNLVYFGLPCPHKGAVMAEYRAFFGSLDGFEDYYQQLIQDEITQGIGRQRVQHYGDQQFTLDVVATYGEDFDLSFLTERYSIKVIEREAVEFCGAAGTTAEKLKHGISDIAKGLKAAGEEITQQAIATVMGISQQALSKHLKALWGDWLELKKLLQLFLRDTNRDGCKNSEQSQPIESTLAAATLIDLFSIGGWQLIRTFLDDLPPPEARFYLGCLLRAAAIA